MNDDIYYHDPRPIVTTFHYDPEGRLYAVEAPTPPESSREHDEAKRVRKKFQNLANSSPVSPHIEYGVCPCHGSGEGAASTKSAGAQVRPGGTIDEDVQLDEWANPEGLADSVENPNGLVRRARFAIPN